MMPKQVTPLSSKRHLIGIALVLLALVIVITSLIAIGFFDPKPIGSLALHQKLNQTVQVVDEIQMALIETPVRDKFSVRLVAALKSGDADIGYGLKIGAPGSSVIVAVSPLGYVTIKNDTDIGDAAHD